MFKPKANGSSGTGRKIGFAAGAFEAHTPRRAANITTCRGGDNVWLYF